MRIIDLIEKNKADVLKLYPGDQEIVDLAEEWKYYSSVKINAPIATGWFDNNDLWIVNGDGSFIYDINKQEIVFEDYDSNLKPGISDDNLKFHVAEKNVTIDIFGLRGGGGGGGNLLTKDNKWALRLINLAWNIEIPIITNMRTGNFYFLKLNELKYEGNIKIGFSKSDDYFVIVGDGGIDIYNRLKI